YGTYSATSSGSTTARDETLTRHGGLITGTATLHEHAGAAAHVSLSLTPDTITADGTSTSTATATVTDAFSNPVSGDTVTFSTNGEIRSGSTTDNGDGTYAATITCSTTAGDETITGHDGLITGTATLHEHAGAAAHLSLSLTPDTITANGVATSTATATVTDAFSNPVSGDTVTFTTNGDVTFGSTTDNGDGPSPPDALPTSTAGDETITGHDGLITGTATLHEHAGAAAHLSLSLTPDTITANGVATSTATATVTDAHSNPVAGETITFSTSGDVTFGSTTDNGDGTYSATITSSTTAGDETITGHDGLITGTATLHEHAGAAAHLS